MPRNQRSVIPAQAQDCPGKRDAVNRDASSSPTPSFPRRRETKQTATNWAFLAARLDPHLRGDDDREWRGGRSKYRVPCGRNRSNPTDPGRFDDPMLNFSGQSCALAGMTEWVRRGCAEFGRRVWCRCKSQVMAWRQILNKTGDKIVRYDSVIFRHLLTRIAKNAPCLGLLGLSALSVLCTGCDDAIHHDDMLRADDRRRVAQYGNARHGIGLGVVK